MITGRSKQVHKRTTKKTSRRVRARTGSADPPVRVSAETSAVPPSQVIQGADIQTMTQAGAAAASLLLEAIQVKLSYAASDYYFDINFSLTLNCTEHPYRSTTIGSSPSSYCRAPISFRQGIELLMLIFFGYSRNIFIQTSDTGNRHINRSSIADFLSRG